MRPLAIDADVHGPIVRGLLRQAPDIDLVRAQDALPEGTPDELVLDWAASEGRFLVTNDRQTMVGFGRARVRQGKSTVGVIVTTKQSTIGSQIEDVLLIAEEISDAEIETNIAIFLPFS